MNESEGENMDNSIRAIIFPGQGSQREGMGRDFHEKYRSVRTLYEAASDLLGVDLREISFSEDDERLHLTEFTQPAILVNEIALYTALREETGFTFNLFAGHSLGEYTALVAGGAIRFEDAVKIVRRRGALMQSAVPAGQGAMAALKQENLDLTCARPILEDHDVEIANLNSKSQVVISGMKESIDNAVTALQAEIPEMEIVPLPVSAPFHSRWMKVIEGDFGDYLKKFMIRPGGAARVLSNFTGTYHEIDCVPDNLVRQISGPVRWIDNMNVIHAQSSDVVEVGPGRPLGGFFVKQGFPAPPSVVTVRCLEKFVKQQAVSAPSAPVS